MTDAERSMEQRRVLKRVQATMSDFSHSDDPLDASVDLLRMKELVAEMKASLDPDDPEVSAMLATLSTWESAEIPLVPIDTQGWHEVASERASEKFVLQARHGTRISDPVSSLNTASFTTSDAWISGGFGTLAIITGSSLLTYVAPVIVSWIVFGAGEFILAPILWALSHQPERITIKGAFGSELCRKLPHDDPRVVEILLEVLRLGGRLERLDEDIRADILKRLADLCDEEPLSKREAEAQLYRMRHTLNAPSQNKS